MSRYLTQNDAPGDYSITQYIKERDEAVKSMDVNKFKDFIKNHSMRKNIPSDEAIEIAMRKMAVHITNFDVDTRVDAFRWLLERGYDPYLN